MKFHRVKLESVMRKPKESGMFLILINKYFPLDENGNILIKGSGPIWFDTEEKAEKYRDKYKFIHSIQFMDIVYVPINELYKF